MPCEPCQASRQLLRMDTRESRWPGGQRKVAQICLMVAAASVALAVPARGGVPIYRTCEEQVGDEGIDLMAVTVLAADPAQTTNVAPPLLGLRVEKVFDGKTRERYVKAHWTPSPSPRDLSDTVPAMYDRSAQAQWEAERLLAPPIDARLIVLTWTSPEGRWILHDCRYQDTPAERARVLQAVRKATAERAALMAEEAAFNERTRARDRARITEARKMLPDLCAASESIWIAAVGRVGSEADGMYFTLAEPRVLKGGRLEAPTGSYPYLVRTPGVQSSIAEVADRYARDGDMDASQRVIAFLQVERRAGSVTVRRFVHPRFGLLPADPDLVSEVESAVTAQRDSR